MQSSLSRVYFCYKVNRPPPSLGGCGEGAARSPNAASAHWECLQPVPAGPGRQGALWARRREREEPAPPRDSASAAGAARVGPPP